MMRRLIFLMVLGQALPALAAAGGQTLVEQGRYLATAGDCVACHTAAGGKFMAGGRSIGTPFGKLLTPNLTPDKETGIGAWTDEQFVRAMREGVGHKGEFLYGAFPYTAYTKVTVADIKAIRAYLNTVPPVRNKVEANQMPFPFNIRLSLWFWNLLFFDKGEYQPDKSKSVEWNRGAYLVQGLGHCVTCHSSKNVLGGDKRDGFLRGFELEGWVAPTITGDHYQGIGAWTTEEIVEYLKTGRNRHSAASGPMAEVISNSTSALTHADLKAMAVYLQSVKANIKPPPPVPASDKRMVAGARIFRDTCAGCHMAQGTGVPRLIPSLVGSGAVQADDSTTLVNVILRGARAVATDLAPTGPAMPGLGWRLTNEEVASVSTYVRNAWGNSGAPVAPATVAKLRKTLEKEGAGKIAAHPAARP